MAENWYHGCAQCQARDLYCTHCGACVVCQLLESGKLITGYILHEGINFVNDPNPTNDAASGVDSSTMDAEVKPKPEVKPDAAAAAAAAAAAEEAEAAVTEAKPEDEDQKVAENKACKLFCCN